MLLRPSLLPCVLSFPLLALAAMGCSESSSSLDASADAPADSATADGGGGDAHADAPSDAGSRPDSCADPGDASPMPADGGETCIGFGPGEPCTAQCGYPPYGFVCTGGEPSLPTGCVLARASSLGDTFCCATLACTRVALRDEKCATKAQKKLYQCFGDADAGVVATPPVGCVELVNDPELTSAKSRGYCCP
jgi:hypothetical protein